MNIEFSKEYHEYSEGDTVEDSKGRTGKFLGVEIQNGNEYYKVDYGEYIGLILKDNNELKKLEDDKNLSEIQSMERERILDVKRKDLEKHIKKNAKRLSEIQAGSAPKMLCEGELKSRLSEILDIASDSGYTFHGDGRHPYAKSEYDKSKDIKKGVFETGIASGEDADKEARYASKVHQTADIVYALEYPDSAEMPKDWDGTRFVYIVDPRGVYETIEEIDPVDYKEGTEIATDKIAPEDIRFAVAVRDNEVIEVFENDNFREE